MATANVLERVNEIEFALLTSGSFEEFSGWLRDIVKPIEPKPGFIGRNAAHEIDVQALLHINPEVDLSGRHKGDESAWVRSELKRHFVKAGLL